MVIAFDPGVTTGIALITNGGKIVDTWAIREPSGVEDLALQLQLHFPAANTVGEAPPQNGGNYRIHTQKIEEIIKRIFPDTHWANPGQWKGHPAARPDPSLKGRTQHEKDAASLGRWYKSTRSLPGGTE